MNLVINLDKPKGITSQEAVTSIKRLLSVKKAGHTGTLDPIATGVLLVCLNEATKIARFLMGLDKEYIARIKLGEKTDTLDSEGKVIERLNGFSFTWDDIVRVIKRFQGEIEQTPPMYSAIKKKGKPLYKLARKGLIIEREKRLVRINRIDLLSLDLPFFDIRVHCSKGTYIRTLCSDIGDALGVGGHVVELRRTAIGNFSVSDSITFEELRNILQKGMDYLFKSRSIISIDSALVDMEEVLLKEEDVKKAKKGLLPKYLKDVVFSSGYIKLKDINGNLFGIAKAQGELIRIERILNL